MLDWQVGEVRPVPLDGLGQHYRRYRLPDAEAEAALARSLARYGQVAPVVVCLREETPEVVDGFKRLAAARTLPGMKALSARLFTADERTAKAAIYGLNRAGRHTRELEEAWIVWALVREDGLTQVEAAELLGRHKSWVCRRLALRERLAEPVQDDLRLGLLTATAARALLRLPAGNQVEALAAARRDGLSAAELDGVVDLLAGAAGRAQQEYVLAQPRQALRQAAQAGRLAHDPRLSPAATRAARRLGYLLEDLARMEAWLCQRGRAELTPGDRGLLAPAFARLARDARGVADRAEDLAEEGPLP
jgi:ParB-like chromosome segregation protein Spo0J